MLVSATSPVAQALVSPHFGFQPRVSITTSGNQGASSELVDITDRLVAFSVSQSLNDATGSALITLARGKGVDSLSPLIDASRFRFAGGRPVADPGLSVVLNADIDAFTGFGALSVGTFFDGRIDRVNIAASATTITLQCRDSGARYLNRFIVKARPYGTLAGMPIEAVMGQILTDNGFSTFSLYTPVSPGFAITDFFTGEVSVMESLRILAQQIGWDIRHFSQDPADLTFYDPARDRIFADVTLGPTRYSALTDLSIGDEDVRNSWDVYFPDAVTPAHAEDAESIARYGLRAAVIGENRTLNIRALPAAQRLADGALADSKDPFASHEVRMPIFPIVELNDIQQYQANGQEYDRDQQLAVVGYRHDWKAGPVMPTTTIQARAKPIAAYREYRKLPPAPKVIASTLAPDPARYAPEGTLWVKYTPA